MRIEKHKNGKKFKIVKGYFWWKKTIKVFPGFREAVNFIIKNK